MTNTGIRMELNPEIMEKLICRFHRPVFLLLPVPTEDFIP